MSYSQFDPNLVKLASAGNRASIELLFEQAWPVAYRLAYVLMRNANLAQETAQDACVSAFRGLHKLREPTYFGSWFYRIVVNAARNITRKFETYESLRDTRMELPSIHEKLEIEEALMALSRDQREVVLLRYYCDLSSFEIARILGIPAGTVRTRLLRAREILAQELYPDETLAQHEALWKS